MSGGENDVSIMPGDWHKVYPDEFEEALMEAAGALSGWMLGNGVPSPHWTPEFTEGFRYAAASAFNRGFHTAAEPEGAAND